MKRDKEMVLDQFLKSARRYKDAMHRSKDRGNVFKTIFLNLRQFGMEYVWYHLPYLRPPWLRSKLFFGKYMHLPLWDTDARVFSMYGFLPEKSEKKLTQWFIKNLKDEDIFYDVGAHMGYYTALGEEIIEGGEVHSFEANPELTRYLYKNFGLSKKVHVVSRAVVDVGREVDFYKARRELGSSFGSRFKLAGIQAQRLNVRGISLDEYVGKGHRPPTVVKLDIEGGEYDALLGARHILENSSPVIVMEVWGGESGMKYSQKALSELLDHGYRVYRINESGDLLDELQGSPVEYISPGDRDNLVFIKN